MYLGSTIIELFEILSYFICISHTNPSTTKYTKATNIYVLDILKSLNYV